MPTHHFLMSLPGRESPSLVSTRVSMLEPSTFARMTRIPSRSHQYSFRFFSSSCSCLGVKVSPGRTNVGNVASVKIRALDGTVIGVGVAHVGPIEVTSPGVHDDAVWKSPSLAHNYLEVGAVGVRGKHLTTARTEKEQTGRCSLCYWFADC